MNIFKKVGFNSLFFVALVVTNVCPLDGSGFKNQLQVWGQLDRLASDSKIGDLDNFLRERDKLLSKLESGLDLGLKAIFERYDMYQYSDDSYSEDSALGALEKSEDLQASVILKVLELDWENTPCWSGGAQVKPCEITLANHPVRVLQHYSKSSLLASCVLAMLYDKQFREPEYDEWAKKFLASAQGKIEELDVLCDKHKDSDLSRGWACLRPLLEGIVARYPKDLSVARYSDKETSKADEGGSDSDG